MKGQKDGTYNRMRKFTIREISAVPAGAMGEGSNMSIIKSFEKKSALTDPMDGHSHLLSGFDDNTSGTTSYNETGDGSGHSHPWIVGLNGEIVVGAANQHTHRVGFFSKQAVADVTDETHITPEQLSASSAGKNPADPTPKDSHMEPTEAELKLQEQIDALTKSLETSSKMAELSDAEKAYLKNLEGDEAAAFLANENRGEIVTKAAEADPVVGEFEGREIRKSDDPTGMIAALIVKAKDDKKKLSFLEEKGKKKDLEKRAEALSHLSGDLATKVAMLKGIDSIEDEGTRKLALESLVSANVAKSGDFAVVGTDGDVSLEKGSAEAELDTMAKAVQAADPSLSFEQAYTKVAQTDEGQVLYNKTLEA